MDTKQCRQCLEIKHITEYRKHERCKDGRINFCNACYKIRYGASIYKFRHSEKRKEWRRKYSSEVVSFQPQRKDFALKSAKITDKKYPEKRIARTITRRAIEKGVLVRPELCSVCNKSPKRNYGRRHTIQAHHEDYSKPLEVIWVCALCHTAIHRNSALDNKEE